jgi:hypothetical protein
MLVTHRPLGVLQKYSIQCDQLRRDGGSSHEGVSSLRRANMTAIECQTDAEPHQCVTRLAP